MRVDWCVSSWFRIKNTHSAALGSEDWCNPVHGGVFSDGRPSVHGVAPSPTAPASSRVSREWPYASNPGPSERGWVGGGSLQGRAV